MSPFQSRLIRTFLIGPLWMFTLVAGLWLTTPPHAQVANGAAAAVSRLQGGITVTLPITLTVAGARWEVANNGGTNAVNQVDNSPGLTIRDCCGPNQYYSGKPNPAYDAGFTLRVGHPISNPLSIPIVAAPLSGEVFSETNRITAVATPLSSLELTMDYYFIPSAPTIRTLASFHNPGATPISVQAFWASKEGAQDTERFVASTSSGEATFTTVDRWVIVGDSSANSPVNTHVLFGPASPEVVPTLVTQVVFESGGETGGVGARYLLTIPPGATRRLMFFNQIQADTGAAIAAAPAFDFVLREGGVVVSELAVPLGEIVNWREFPPVYLPLIRR